MHPKAKDSRNYTQCDSLLIGDKCGAHTVPYIEVKNNSSRVEHEATTSKWTTINCFIADKEAWMKKKLLP